MSTATKPQIKNAEITTVTRYVNGVKVSREDLAKLRITNPVIQSAIETAQRRSESDLDRGDETEAVS